MKSTALHSKVTHPSWDEINWQKLIYILPTMNLIKNEMKKKKIEGKKQRDPVLWWEMDPNKTIQVAFIDGYIVDRVYMYYVRRHGWRLLFGLSETPKQLT